jgi:hypothetical protein
MKASNKVTQTFKDKEDKEDRIKIVDNNLFVIKVFGTKAT